MIKSEHEWYLNHKEQVKASTKIWYYLNKKRSRELIRNWVQEHPLNNKLYRIKYRTNWNKLIEQEILKRNNQCERCKNSYPRECYEWHHRNSKDKKFDISQIISQAYSNKHIIKLKIELSKCDLVCANCHKIITLGGKLCSS
jgi:hypothetical protein